MKNAPHPSSTSARAAARHTDTYDTSVPEASTTRIRSEAEIVGMWVTAVNPRYTREASRVEYQTRDRAGSRPITGDR